MTNKLTSALGRAANNFQRGDVRQVEQQEISVADAMGLREPISAEMKAGVKAIGTAEGIKFNGRIATYERWKSEKAAYEKQRDDELWRKIQARRVAL
jgi:hypothetical protein